MNQSQLFKLELGILMSFLSATNTEFLLDEVVGRVLLGRGAEGEVFVLEVVDEEGVLVAADGFLVGLGVDVLG